MAAVPWYAPNSTGWAGSGSGNTAWLRFIVTEQGLVNGQIKLKVGLQVKFGSSSYINNYPYKFIRGKAVFGGTTVDFSADSNYTTLNPVPDAWLDIGKNGTKSTWDIYLTPDSSGNAAVTFAMQSTSGGTVQMLAALDGAHYVTFSNESATVTVHEDVTSGTVWIYDGGWKECVPYVYDGGWQKCEAYIYDNGWVKA